MDIEKLYNSIFADLESIRQSDIAEKAAALAKERSQKKQLIQRINELDRNIEEIEPFQRTAAAYVSSIVTQRFYSPRRIDIPSLEDLYFQATTATINASYYWERLYEAASSGISYYTEAKSSVLTNNNSASSAASSNKHDEACRNVITGGLAQQLRKAFQIVDSNYTPRILVSKAFSLSQKDSTVLFGKATKPFPVTDGCIALSKQFWGAYYLEKDSSLLLPCTLPDVTFFQIGSNAAEKVMSAIRAYILAFLCYTKLAQQKINYIDTCMMDLSCLGVLKPLLQGSGDIIMPVPTSYEASRNQLTLLRQSLASSTIQGRRLLVYRFRQSLHDAQSEAQMQWICANAGNYNIQVIAVQETARHLQDLERQVPDWLPADSLILRVGEHNYLEAAKSLSKIATYPEPSELSQAFLDGIIKAYAPALLQTRYFSIRPVPKVLSYRRQRQEPLSLLYGVGENGEKYTLDLTGADFSAYILGAARSGKSNLLNILITSAILDYHPDDLELWLVDFGRTEFNRYIHHTPPHARYVLVEKTTELVSSLVDKLIEEMDYRGKIMSQHHVLKMQDLPESVQMPKLLVIIDEFGVFKEILLSDEFEEKKKYRLYMERLLKQGAKHGMCFIFSNQSYTDVYSALPEEGSDQIGLRLAMLAKDTEMKAVLEMRGSQLTEEEEMRIRRLPKYQVLFRSREHGGELSKPVHVLYFTQEDKKTQESLIDWMNKELKPTAKSRLDSPSTYQARQQLLLDHDSIPTFSTRFADIKNDYDEWKKNPAYQNTDLLLYIGEPRNMDSVHHELLRQARAENMLLYGDYARSLDKIARVVAAAVNSAAFQNWPVEYWCDERDALTKRYIDNWRIGTMIKDRNELVAHIQELDRQLKNKSLTKRLVVVAGLSSIVQAVQDEIEEKAMFGGEMGEAGFQKIRDLMAKGGVLEQQESGDEDAMENIAAYLNRLLLFGSRYDVHFLVIIQKEAELSDSNLTTSHFTHYAAFANGLSDTQYLQFKRRVDRISEEEMFGCMTGNNEFTVYTPFSL